MLTQNTQSHLTRARNAIEQLKQAAGTSIDSGSLPTNQESIERDVRGASNKFLAETKQERLTKRSTTKTKDPRVEDGWVTLRFRITLEQRDIIMSAMERVREMVDSVSGKVWKGVALEYVAAEFLAANGYPAELPNPQNPTGP